MADLNDLQKFEDELKNLVRRDKPKDNEVITLMAVHEHGRPFQEHQLRPVHSNPQTPITPWTGHTQTHSPQVVTYMSVHEHGRPFDHQLRPVYPNPQAPITPWTGHTQTHSPQVITRMAVHEHGRPFMSTNMAVREHGQPYQNNCGLKKILEDNARELMGNVTFMGVPEHGRPFQK